MNQGSHHSDVDVRASLRAGWKAWRAMTAAALLSGLISIAAIAPVAAEQTFCERVLSSEGYAYGSVVECLAEAETAKQAAEEAARKAKEAAAAEKASPPKTHTVKSVKKELSPAERYDGGPRY
jgi:hypothetical protein